MIFSDPKVGVPTPMLMQWPDKYYHTSADTPDKVSADVMRRIVVTSAAYAFTCALAEEKDLVWIAGLTGRGLRKMIAGEMAGFAASEAGNWITAEFKARFLAHAGDQALRSVRRLLPEGRDLKAHLKIEERAVDQAVKREAAVAASLAGLTIGRRRRHRPKGEAQFAVVAKRLFPGPVDTRSVLSRVSSARRAQYRRWLRREKRAGLFEVQAAYWANGRRSVREISHLVAAEVGATNSEFIRFYFDLLEEAGLVTVAR